MKTINSEQICLLIQVIADMTLTHKALSTQELVVYDILAKQNGRCYPTPFTFT